jgi:hypothetical protein
MKRTIHKNVRKYRIASGIAALVLLGAACGDSDDAVTDNTAAPAEESVETTNPDTSAAAPSSEAMSDEMDDEMDEEMDEEAAVNGTETGAPSLRALLTAQLQEHVYLAGTAVYTAVNVPDHFPLAAATLDQNSMDLAASIGSVYGEPAGEAFLELWRTHIGFFVDYTTARAGGDEAGQEAARAGLFEYREDFAAFISGANPMLPKDAVIEELQPHVVTVFAAIDAVVDGYAGGFDELKIAANQMPHTAGVLADGFDSPGPSHTGESSARSGPPDHRRPAVHPAGRRAWGTRPPSSRPIVFGPAPSPTPAGPPENVRHYNEVPTLSPLPPPPPHGPCCRLDGPLSRGVRCRRRRFRPGR